MLPTFLANIILLGLFIQAHATLHTYYEPCGPEQFDITAPKEEPMIAACSLASMEDKVFRRSLLLNISVLHQSKWVSPDLLLALAFHIAHIVG